MKKICMISQSTFPFDPRVKREAEALEEAGYEIDLICLSVPGQPKTERVGAITVNRILGEVSQERIYKYIITSTLFFILTFFKLQSLNHKRRYDVIQIHNMPEFHVYTTIIQKLSGIPIVLDIHDLTPELFQSKWRKNKNRFLLSLIIYAEKLSTSFADKVITVTDGCKNILIKRGVPGEKITLVLNTPESKNFTPDRDREFEPIVSKARVLYHGTVAERFGIHVVIEAFPKFLELVPESVFNIYGRYDPTYREYLEKRIKELNLEDAVNLYPRVSLEEVKNIINKSDIGVVPYVSNTYMNIALSTKAFEYAAMGLPVIATPLKTLSQTFPTNTVLYAADRDPADWADKLHILCMYPDLRSSLTHNALKIVSNISGDKMMKRYVDLINSTVNKENDVVINFSDNTSPVTKKVI